jgi:uncharacterized membrane protein
MLEESALKRHVAAGLMVAAVAAAGVFAGPKLLEAQQGTLPASHVIVVRDVAHVISPRLGGMKPIPPAYGLRKQIALRHARPVQSAVQPSAPDPVLQTAEGPLVPTTSGTNFLGVGNGLSGFTVQYAPPDTNGSAGATQYVQWVNVDFAVFSKSTGSVIYGPAAGNTLWTPLGGACASSNSGDPIAQYDKQANRWVMLQPVFSSPYYLCVAVSTTSDATGSYNLYQFPIPSNHFPDYPKLAVWPDGYYVSYNDFGSGGNNYTGTYACALDRASMLAGNAATMQCFNAGNSHFSLLPADLDGDSPSAPGTTAAPPANAPENFIELNYSTLSALDLYQFHVDWSNSSNSTFTGPVVISVAPFAEACGGGTCVPQSGTSEQLDSLGDRLMYRVAYRNFGSYESLLVSHSVNTGSGNTGIRWYEIRNPGSNPTVYQQGTFAPDSSYRWMPSIAEDEKGDIALGYSVSSGTMHPAIRFTGRVPGDALGTMETENSIIEGAGSQLTNLSRWGDYSNMSVDPVDDCTFWYTNEYERANGTFNWSTRVASFTFPGCATTATPDFSLSGTPTSQTITAGSGTSYTVDVAPSGGYTGSVTLSISSPNPLPAGMTATFSPNPAGVTGTSTVSSALSVNTTTSTPTGTYNLTVSGTDGTNTHTTQVSVVVQAPPTPDFSLSSSPGSQTVTQGSSTTYTIGVSPSGGFTGDVSLSATGLPSGATASFNPNPASTSGGATTSTMTVTTSGSTPTGTSTITVAGTSGSLNHSIQVTLTVQQTTSSDFTISATPSIAAAAPGSSTSYTVTVAGSGTGPFNGTVNLSVGGVPSRTSSSFNTTSITGSGSATLTVSPHHNAQNGTYTLTITGTSGSLSHSATVTFVIGTISTPDFSLSASPNSQTVAPGAGTSYSVAVTPSGGYSKSVSLSVTGLPSGASASFNPASVTPNGGAASSTLSVSTITTTPAGNYSLTITGFDGTLTHTTSVTLSVQSSGGSGDFSLSASPSTLSLTAKSSASSTVTIASSGGFTGTVSLSVSGLPHGVSASFNPSSATSSSTLTVTTGGHPQTGSYPLTITGTSGSLSHSTTVTLTVN